MRKILSRGTTKIGSFMLLVAWILFMIVLTYVFSRWLSYSMNPNSNVSSKLNNNHERIITLKANRYNHYLVSGQINGFNVDFLVDTGATSVAVPEHIAVKIGLKPGNIIRVSTANGEVNARAAIINSLSIGDIELHSVSASINPNDNSDKVLLGMSALKRFSFIQENGVLVLRLKN